MADPAPHRKARLRAHLRRELAALDPATARRAAGDMARHVLALPEMRDARQVLACLSFGTEIDTWGLIERMLEEGREVYVPRTEPATRSLRFHRYPCPLETRSFGLREPSPQTPSLPPEAVDATLDAALLVGLAFDGEGFRLGHGGGYFDRFLPGRPFPTLGLAYETQILPRVPREPHDVPLTMVVTEAGVRRPRSRPRERPDD